MLDVAGALSNAVGAATATHTGAGRQVATMAEVKQILNQHIAQRNHVMKEHDGGDMSSDSGSRDSLCRACVDALKLLEEQ